MAMPTATVTVKLEEIPWFREFCARVADLLAAVEGADSCLVTGEILEAAAEVRRAVNRV